MCVYGVAWLRDEPIESLLHGFRIRTSELRISRGKVVKNLERSFTARNFVSPRTHLPGIESNANSFVLSDRSTHESTVANRFLRRLFLILFEYTGIHIPGSNRGVELIRNLFPIEKNSISVDRGESDKNIDHVCCVVIETSTLAIYITLYAFSTFNQMHL